MFIAGGFSNGDRSKGQTPQGEKKSGAYAAANGPAKELNPFSSPAIGIVLKIPVNPKKANAKPIKIRAVVTKAINKKIPEVVEKIKRCGKSAQYLDVCFYCPASPSLADTHDVLCHWGFFQRVLRLAEAARKRL
jgi:hypothetical protein